MSFIERLRQLRQKEEMAQQEQSIRAKEQEDAIWRPREEAFNLLVQAGQENLLPLLKAVNKEYLKNEGYLSQSPNHVVYFEAGGSIRWILAWGEGNDGDFGNESWGNRLRLELGSDKSVKIYAGNSILNEADPLKLGGAGLQEQLGEIVYAAIASGQTYWHKNHSISYSNAL